MNFSGFRFAFQHKSQNQIASTFNLITTRSPRSSVILSLSAVWTEDLAPKSSNALTNSVWKFSSISAFKFILQVVKFLTNQHIHFLANQRLQIRSNSRQPEWQLMVSVLCGSNFAIVRYSGSWQSLNVHSKLSQSPYIAQNRHSPYCVQLHAPNTLSCPHRDMKDHNRSVMVPQQQRYDGMSF